MGATSIITTKLGEITHSPMKSVIEVLRTNSKIPILNS